MQQKKCKWTGQAKCHLAERCGVYIHSGEKIKPFECCDNKVANQKMHCTCQPTTMGFMTKEEYQAEVINDKSKISYWTK